MGRIATTQSNDKLYQHVYMRSSDAWLGIPYDMFSFSCIGLKVACIFNTMLAENRVDNFPRAPIGLGGLTITATSAHLYEEHFKEAAVILQEYDNKPVLEVRGVPEELVRAGRWDLLLQDLELQEAGMEPANGWKVSL